MALAISSMALACDSLPSAPKQLASRAPASSIEFDPNATDSPVNGSEVQLSGFDGVSQLAYSSAKGSFIANFDNNTIFRGANLNRFAPTDPCRQFAVDYNTAGEAGDAAGVFSAISSMSTSGCLARLHVDKHVPPNPTVPPNPVRSFRPLATF